MEKKKHTGCIIALAVLGGIFVLLILAFAFLLFIGIIITTPSNENKEIPINSSVATQTTVEPFKEIIAYEDNNFSLKIIGVKKTEIFDGIQLQLEIENKTNKDVKFSTENDVVIDGYTVKGAGEFQEVKANTKAHEPLSIYNALNDNTIDFDNIKSLTFWFNIYESENYIKTKEHITKQKVVIDF